MYGLQNQTTNFIGKRQYVDKYWNPFINSIEVSEENNDIYFYKTKKRTSQ